MRSSKAKWYVMALVAVVAVALGTGAAYITGTFKYPASGGDLSPYLVGFYDVEEGEATVYLANPTPYDLDALVVQFDRSGSPVRCEVIRLCPNAYGEFEIEPPDTPSEQGVLKIISVKPPFPAPTVVVQAGVMAWIRHEAFGGGEDPSGIGDTDFKAAPGDLLTANANYELNKILNYCSNP